MVQPLSKISRKHAFKPTPVLPTDNTATFSIHEEIVSALYV